MDAFIVINVESEKERKKILRFLRDNTESGFKFLEDPDKLKDYVSKELNVIITDRDEIWDQASDRNPDHENIAPPTINQIVVPKQEPIEEVAAEPSMENKASTPRHSVKFEKRVKLIDEKETVAPITYVDLTPSNEDNDPSSSSRPSQRERCNGRKCTPFRDESMEHDQQDSSWARYDEEDRTAQNSVRFGSRARTESEDEEENQRIVGNGGLVPPTHIEYMRPIEEDDGRSASAGQMFYRERRPSFSRGMMEEEISDESMEDDEEDNGRMPGMVEEPNINYDEDQTQNSLALNHGGILSTRRSKRVAKREGNEMDSDDEEKNVPETKKAAASRVKEDCILCGSGFETYTSKKIHVLVHLKIPRYECLVEGCGYKTWNYIKNHVKSHYGKRIAYRQLQFSQSQTKQHEKLIRRCFPKSFKNDENSCKICGFSFSGSYNKRNHSVSHVDFMRYKCTERGCTFEGKTKITMYGHTQVHGVGRTTKFVEVNLTEEQKVELKNIVTRCFPTLGEIENEDAESGE